MHPQYHSPVIHRRTENHESLPSIQAILRGVPAGPAIINSLVKYGYQETFVPQRNGFRSSHCSNPADNNAYWKERSVYYQRPQPDPGGPVISGVEHNGYPHEDVDYGANAGRADSRPAGAVANHNNGRTRGGDNFPPQLSPTSETASYLENSNALNCADTATVVTETQSEHGDCSEVYSGWAGDGQRLPGSSIHMYLRKFTCKTCRKDFKCESLLRKHNMQHTKPWRCIFQGCKRRDGFTSVNDRDRHMNSVHKQQKGRPAVGYRCRYDQCLSKEKIFWRLDNFRNHVKKKHPSEDVRRAENACRVEASHSYESVIDNSAMDTNSELGSIATPKDHGLSLHGEETGTQIRYDNTNEPRHPHQDFSLYSPTSVRIGVDVPGAQDTPLFDDAMELDEPVSRQSFTNFPPQGGMDDQGVSDTPAGVRAIHAQNAGDQVGKAGPENSKGTVDIYLRAKLRREKLNEFMKSLEGPLMESYALALDESESAEATSRDPHLTQVVRLVIEMAKIYRSYNPTQIPFVSPPEVPDRPLPSSTMQTNTLAPSALLNDNRSHSMNTFMQQSPRDEAPMSRLLSSDPPLSGENDLPTIDTTAVAAGNLSCRKRSASAAKQNPSRLSNQRVSSPSGRSPKKNVPSGPTGNPGTESSKCTPAIGKNGRPVNTDKLLCKCDHAGCNSIFRVPSELKKHKKRHSRPYFCTYKGCNKDFGSKNDWKRHENTQHFQLESWKCDFKVPNSAGICGKSSFRKENHVNHLKNTHGITVKAEIAKLTDKCHIGRNIRNGYWCGFCGDEKKRGIIIQLQKKGFEGWDERYDHLEKHFSAGLRMHSYKHADDNDSGDEGENVATVELSEINRGNIMEGPRERRGIAGVELTVGKDRDNLAGIMQGKDRTDERVEGKSTKAQPPVMIYTSAPPDTNSNEECLEEYHVETRQTPAVGMDEYWFCCGTCNGCTMPGPFLAGLNESCITCQHKRCDNCSSSLYKCVA